MMKAKEGVKSWRLLIAGALIAAGGFVPSASADLLYFDLCNHPEGGAANANVDTWYGLRLDLPDGNTWSGVNTFSFQEGDGAGANTVFAILDTDTGGLTIGGTVFHNQDDDEAYLLLAEIVMDTPLTAAEILWLGTGGDGGPFVLNGNTTALTLTPVGTGDFDVLDWTGFMDPSFQIVEDERGVPGLSGIGWVEPDGGSHISAQDWLFLLKPRSEPPPPFEPPVPEPATLSLLGLGLGGLAIRAIKKKRS